MNNGSTTSIVDALGSEEQALSWYYYLAEPIRCGGLWNTHHVDAQPLTASQFAWFRDLAESSLVGAGA